VQDPIIDGKWLLGPNGSKNLVRLNQKLKEKAVILTQNQRNIDIESYEPWMSSVSLRASWNPSARSSRTLVETNLNYLTELREKSSVQFHQYPARLLNVLNPSNDYKDIEYQDAARIEEFQNKITRLKTNISQLGLDYQTRLESLVHHFILLKPKFTDRRGVRDNGDGLSSHAYRGGIFLNPALESPHRDFEDHLNFIHEVGHQALFVFQCADPIINGDIEAPVYSVIRKTFRPAIQSIHALTAVAYMIELILRAQNSDWLNNTPEEWVENRLSSLMHDLETGIDLIKGQPLTRLGRDVVREFEGLLHVSKKLFPERRIKIG
jgi:hypothetical protein